MKILFLTRLFYPHIGGVEKYVLELSRRLVGKGHTVIVVTEELPITNILVYQLEDTGAKKAENYYGIRV